MRKVQIKDFTLGGKNPLCFFLGPCALESRDLALEVAAFISESTKNLPCNVVFKSSFDKANRSSLSSKRGLGMEAGLDVLNEIKERYGFALVTDIHLPNQAEPVSKVCDVLQIPAFLCRQTDLLVAAANTGACIKVKKGQFVAPSDMSNVVEKIRACGNERIILTERGTTFGYNNLVVDMRSIPLMQQLEVPVCFDASHSVQLPGGLGTESSGERGYIRGLAHASIAMGADAIFIECHPNPDKAISDRNSQLPLSELRPLLTELISLYELRSSFENTKALKASV
jgi:2-dehydro-3-deoxyphosphooctonate aldolase (KDO 8-P synthase)